MEPMILILSAHPEPDSFTGILAADTARKLNTAGIRTVVSDLYRLEGDVPFPALLNAEELKRKTSLDPRVQKQMALVEEARGIVVVHPDWWGGPPAVLKGWVDRVLRPGTAYEVPEGFGPRSPRGLLAGRRALVVVTGDAADSGPLEEFWINRVWGFCGVQADLHYLPGIGESSRSVRTAFLESVTNEAAAVFGGTGRAGVRS